MIAILNNMAYQERLQGKTSKVLQKRILKNQSSEQTQVADLANYSVEAFAKEMKPVIERFGSCFVDQIDLADAIEGKGCFCITFDVERPEAAINDPSRIKILKINPTFISSSALISCIKYHLDIDPMNFGGFHGEQPVVPLTGASNEIIKAAMPIYICQENWHYAKSIIRPVLGWVTTLDAEGYDN